MAWREQSGCLVLSAQSGIEQQLEAGSKDIDINVAKEGVLRHIAHHDRDEYLGDALRRGGGIEVAARLIALYQSPEQRSATRLSRGDLGGQVRRAPGLAPDLHGDLERGLLLVMLAQGS